ncbi:MAG: hypothetical protein ACP5H6_03485 [Caldivirga sp.]
MEYIKSPGQYRLLLNDRLLNFVNQTASSEIKSVILLSSIRMSGVINRH